jgi:glutamate 5-kinase
MSKLLVLKIGTSSICDESTYLPKIASISQLVEAIAALRTNGHQVVLVSSGAVGTGQSKLKLRKRPDTISAVQVVYKLIRLLLLWDKGD